MKRESIYIYEVWEDDKKIYEGSAEEVGKHFYTTQNTVATTYRMNYKYLGKYELRKRKRR